MTRELIFPIILLIAGSSCRRSDILQYADPNIGGVSVLLTTKRPTVHRPNSMVRVFPVTKPGFGDRYLSDRIYGFALNMPEYRMDHVTELMPVSGKFSTNRNETAEVYDHDLEEVHPWYHRVLLEDNDITAEWTTTERSVLYRFGFKDVRSNYILFRSNGNAHFKISGKSVIQGWEEFENTRQYFYAEFSEPFDSSGTFVSGKVNKGGAELHGDGIGAFVQLPSLGKRVEIRIGISYISEDQAKQNLAKEADRLSFERIKKDSREIWEKSLGRIYAEGGTERQKRIFYTSFYRACERMVNISENGKYYSGYDKKVHDDDGQPFYMDDWLWDTFRSLHPLFMILDPASQDNMVQSYTRMFEQSGWMPGFPQVSGDFSAMIGFHSASLVWNTWLEGARNFDVEKAYEGLKKNALHGTMLPWRNGPMCKLDTFYQVHGWYPALPEDSTETVSMVHGFEKRQAVAVTLEHSYDDWCLAQLANALGKKEDYALFLKRSQNYRNVYNPATGFMAPRKEDGKWVEPFDPQLSGGIGSRSYYAENNAWIWRFCVMHDIPGLIDLMGGDKSFANHLDALFNQPTEISKWQFMARFPDATGLNGMFPAGNEPAFHVPYLYDYAGMPWMAQKRIREIMDLWFDDDPLGLPGDEDGGALCSWYVFSAMGFYPVTPGSGTYAIGSPLFRKISIRLPNGKTFVIKARGCSKTNKYIQAARLNGKKFDSPFIDHSVISAGGILVLDMGERPNKQWGIIHTAH
jgi:predicted alpha-1,2-mannosidase